jgi:hypothetical protein
MGGTVGIDQARGSVVDLASSAWQHEQLMRALSSGAVTSVLLFISGLSTVGLSACGVATEGLLAAPDGGGGRIGATRAPGADGAPGSDDGSEDGSVDPPTGDDAAPSGDDAEPSGDDGAVGTSPPPPGTDSGTTKDAGTTAPLTCSQCAAQKCPTQVAACQQGSACLGYRDCDESCAGAAAKTCTAACSADYPGGASAYGSLALCVIPCGTLCVVTVTTGTP